MDGSKIETRRSGKIKYKVGKVYGVTWKRFQKSQGHIKINAHFEQRLCDVTEEQAKAEGFCNLSGFLEFWVKNTGYLIPWQTVDAYELCKTEMAEKA
jgi:hypothetical protein